MGRKFSLARRRAKNQWRSRKTSKAKDNSINLPDPPENTATVEKGKDPPNATSL